jgi:membrane protein DedA with SNARE-associated domain
MLSVWFGSFLGDQVWFHLGRRYGTAALRRFPGAERRVECALRFLARYGDGFVLTFRFVYGIRNVASAACGMAGMSHVRFAALNFMAAGLWAGCFVGGGWYLASWLGPEGVGYLFGAVGVSVILWLMLRFWRGSRRVKPAI